MKRLGSSDSLSAMASMCPNSTDGDNQVSDNPMYKREFQAMLDGLDEEGCIDESGNKKRRLSIDQVKALEKNFEVENKLDPERKLKLALDLGLQPRQVAVWFQNRRARWKTKQLERDYGVLKASYDGLKLNYEKLQLDNEALLKEIRELKAKLSEDGKSELSDKEDHAIVSDAAAAADKKTNLETDQQTDFLDPKCEEIVAATEMEIQDFNNSAVDNILCDFKDGSSDSDSSAILNEDNNNSNSPTAAISSSSAAPHQFLSGTNINFLMSSVLVNGDGDIGNAQDHKDYVDYQHPFVKIEEHNFLGHVDDSCTNLFSDDQAPSLPWICSDEWN